MYSFTKDTATTILGAMKAKGYVIEHGLDGVEIQAVEKAFNATLPSDYRIFLQTGIIKGYQGLDKLNVRGFVDWRNPEAEAASCKDWIENHVFRFDIEKNGYWHPELFGEKPRDMERAVQQVLAIVRTWPPLFPIYIHRFICSSPHEAGNPILSVWQAVDTVYYGANLLDYMDREFKLGLDVAKKYPMGVAVPRPVIVPIWTKALFDMTMSGAHFNNQFKG